MREELERERERQCALLADQAALAGSILYQEGMAQVLRERRRRRRRHRRRCCHQQQQEQQRSHCPPTTTTTTQRRRGAPHHRGEIQGHSGQLEAAAAGVSCGRAAPVGCQALRSLAPSAVRHVR